MSEEISKFNFPGESRTKYGESSFDDAADELAVAVDGGDPVRPQSLPKPQREGELDEDVLASARDTFAKYGRG